MRKLIIAAVLLMGTSAFACEVPEACQLNQNKANETVAVVATVATIAEALDVNAEASGVATKPADSELEAELNRIGIQGFNLLLTREPGAKCAEYAYSIVGNIASFDKTSGTTPTQYDEGVMEIGPDFFATIALHRFINFESNKMTYVVFRYFGTNDKGKEMCNLDRVVTVNRN